MFVSSLDDDGQHVPRHLVPVPAPEDARSLQIGTCFDRQRLGAHQPGSAGPGRHADDDDDVDDIVKTKKLIDSIILIIFWLLLWRIIEIMLECI